MNSNLTLLLVSCAFLTLPLAHGADAESNQAPKSFRLQLEGAVVWQTRNTFRLPGPTGTEVRLADFSNGPVFAGRLYAEWSIDEHHGLRALIAPFHLTVGYTPTQPTSIGGKTFAAGTPVTSKYTFNSYRLTYRYVFNPHSPLAFRLGFTGKLRDANIVTSDGSQVAENPNLGFVPLIHLGARWTISPSWFVDFDADALAAPQGRAEDLSLRLGYVVDPIDVAFGYRLLEGGASNDSVFTFAMLHYLFASVGFYF